MRLTNKLLCLLSISLNIFFIFGHTFFSHNEPSKKKIQSYIEAFRGSTEKLSAIYDALALNKFTTCYPNDSLQNCIDNSSYSTVYIAKGLHLLEKGLTIDSGKSILIGKQASIMLSDSANMPNKGGYVLGLLGSTKQHI